MQFLGSRHRHHPGLESEITGPGMSHLQPFQPLRRIGEDQATRAMQAATLAGNLFQLVIEVDRIALQLSDIGIAVQRMKAASGMPGRAGGKAIALDKNDIFPASLGQVVEHRTTDDTAADDDNTRLGFHSTILGHDLEDVRVATYPLNLKPFAAPCHRFFACPAYRKLILLFEKLISCQMALATGSNPDSVAIEQH